MTSSSGEREPLTAEEVKQHLSTRRFQERLLHLRQHLDMTPAEGLALGIEMSEAALRARGELNQGSNEDTSEGSGEPASERDP